MMPPKMSRKRRRTLIRLAEEMRAKKQPKSDTAEETSMATGSLNESLPLPGPSALLSSTLSADRESDGEDYGGEFTSDDARVRYDDWLVTLPKDSMQMMAMMLYVATLNVLASCKPRQLRRLPFCWE